jgi:hypothetical protein
MVAQAVDDGPSHGPRSEHGDAQRRTAHRGGT